LAPIFFALALLAFADNAPAQQAAGGPAITAIVAAGSVNNTFTVVVGNANSFAPLRGVRVSLRTSSRYLTNVRVSPPLLDEVGANSSMEVVVSFDVEPAVPADGANETVVFDVAAAGILDQSVLTLRLGIETPGKPLSIVPFVIGKENGEASALLGRQGFQVATTTATTPPPGPEFSGTVAAQSPDAGTIAAVGSRVALTAFPRTNMRRLRSLPRASGRPSRLSAMPRPPTLPTASIVPSPVRARWSSRTGRWRCSPTAPSGLANPPRRPDRPSASLAGASPGAAR
jgi:hypothetical protein